MDARAFCPAHITGFLKASMQDGRNSEEHGSTGAGFSIKRGVTTAVRTRPRRDGEPAFGIIVRGFGSQDTGVSEFVAGRFLGMAGDRGTFHEIIHEVSIPVGYGLGSSGAVALSLALALDRALGTGLGREEVGRIAHEAEVGCRTGLGDVLASYHGGFEVRTRPGAPGVGRVERIPTGGVSVVMVCFSPIPTNRFIRESLPRLNGLGGRMVERLLESRDYGHFQDMSLEFARYAGVMTPRMEALVRRLAGAGLRCGVAMFGETVFAMCPTGGEGRILGMLGEPGGLVISSELEDAGARVLGN